MLPGNVDRCGIRISIYNLIRGWISNVGSKINLAGRGKFKKDTICFC